MTTPIEPATEPDDRYEHWLRVIAPDGVPCVYPLCRSRLVIGRAPECDIILDNDAVSRHHAEILHDPFDRWLIRDLGSRNGLKVEGKRAPEYALLPQTKVRLDKFTLQYTRGISTDKLQLAPQAGACPMTDAAGLEISTCDGQPEARIAASHLFALLDLNGRLMAETSAESRRNLLCEFMVDSSFGAHGAMLLRLDRRIGRDSAQLLGKIHAAATVDRDRFHISRRLLDRVAESGEALLASNAVANAAQVSLSISPGESPMSAVAAPLRRDSRSLDVLYVVLPAESGSHEWLAMTALAAQLFQHAEDQLDFNLRARTYGLIEQDLARAREIQQRLLPTPLDLTGLEVAWCYEPCRWVGGDYLDVMKLPDGRVFLGVADVCGKGMEAALTSSSFHSLMRSLLPGGEPLAEVMRRAGEHLALYLPGGAFVTALGCILDPASGECEVVNAGHPELLRITPDGTLKTVEGGVNQPLGLPGAPPTAQTLSLDRGEAVVMYTDGWPDLASATGERLGDKRFMATIQKSFARHAHVPLPPHLKMICDAAESFRDSALPNDDRALLLARRGD